MVESILKTSVVTDSNADALAAVDVYTQRANTPVNAAKPRTLNVSNDFSPIRNESILADINRVRNSATIEDRITSVDALYSRLGELNTGLKGTLGNLDNASVNELLTALGGDPNSPLGKVVIGSNTFYNQRTKSTNAFAKLVAGILSDNSIMRFFDLEAEGALLSVMINNAISMGLGTLVDDLIQRANDDKLKRKLMSDNLLVAVMMSDISTVKKIVDELGVKRCLGIVPTIVYDLISNYRISINNDRNISNLRTEIETLLARFDDKWDLEVVGGVEQPSFRNTFNASADFKTLYPSTLQPTDDMEEFTSDQLAYQRRVILMMNSRLLRRSDVYSIAKRSYRTAPLMNG